MSIHPDYKRATNTAYQILLDLDTFSLPTNIFSVAKLLRGTCQLLTYGRVNSVYGCPLQQLIAISEYGFTIISKSGKRIILYNESLPLGCIRFTIAHEIGHAILGHKTEDDPSLEKEANCFARNLLCPWPVANCMDASTVTDYTFLFDVTAPMAKTTLNLRDSDKYYLDENLSENIADRLYVYNMGFDSEDALMHYYFEP